VALHNHHDTKKHFPHGTYNYLDSTGTTPAPYNNRQDRRCWMQDTLPFLEQQPLFDRFEDHMRTGASALGFPELDAVIPTLMCPSDPIGPKLQTYWGGIGTPTQGFSGNVVTCAGSGYFNRGGVVNSAQLDGVFFAVSKIRMGDIIDGTSTTAMVGELILSPDKQSTSPPAALTTFAVATTIRPMEECSSARAFRPTPWCPINSTGATMIPCPAPRASIRAPTCFVSVRSYHPGGVNLGLADASVRFVADTVNPVLFTALGSRNGGEAIGAY